MSPQLIAQLVIALGPAALQLIQDLMKVWNQPTIPPDQVFDICSRSQKSYDEYITQAKTPTA